MTGCAVTSSTRLPRKYTTRPSRKLDLYCSTVRRGIFAFPQKIFLDLPSRCFRKLVHKLDSPRALETGQVRIDRAFDLATRNVFSARYDDVLRAVFNFHITIRMDDRKIAGMEPASAKCLLRCFRIAVVTLHDRIPSNDDFADLRAVRFDVAHVLAHHALLCHEIAHALPRLQCSLLFKR